MTSLGSDRELTRIVRSWMEEGVNVLPDRILDDVLAQLPVTPQRGPLWRAWRTRLMSGTLRLGVVGLAVALVAGISLSVYFSRPPVTPAGSATRQSSPEVPTHAVVAPVTASPTAQPPSREPIAAARTPLVPASPPRASEIPHADLDVTAGLWDEADRTHYAMLIRNPNDGVAPHIPTAVYMNFYRGAEFVTSRIENFPAFRLTPEASFGAVGALAPGSTASRVEVFVSSGDWRPTGKADRPIFEVEDLRSREQPDGTYRIRGRLNSNGQALGAPGVEILAVYLNDAGEVIGGQEIVTNHCACGRTDFEFVTGSPMPEFASVEIFWSWPIAGL